MAADYEAMKVELRSDGLPYALNWPERIAIADEVLNDSPYIQLWAEQQGFHMLLGNGHAQWRFLERLPSDLGWIAERVALEEQPT